MALQGTFLSRKIITSPENNLHSSRPYNSLPRLQISRLKKGTSTGARFIYMLRKTKYQPRLSLKKISYSISPTFTPLHSPHKFRMRFSYNDSIRHQRELKHLAPTNTPLQVQRRLTAINT